MKRITGKTTGKRILRAMIEGDQNVRELLAFYVRQRAVEDLRGGHVERPRQIDNLVNLEGRLISQ
jgi:hypothetical protein